jgi:hypothetical protein
VAGAIRLAEDFAKGLACSSVESVMREVEDCRAVVGDDFIRDSASGAAVLAAHAAAAALRALDLRSEPEGSRMSGAGEPNPFPHLAELTADLAARDAFTAAADAAAAVGHSDRFMKGALDDYQKLLRLDLGTYPQAGNPIDLSPDGPLGPLEPGDSSR